MDWKDHAAPAQSAELAIRQKMESISVELLKQAAASEIYKLPANGETEEVRTGGDTLKVQK